MFGLPVSLKKFSKDLAREISDDNVTNGAAALAYYLTLAIFPTLILFLSLLPYLPIPNLERAVFEFLNQVMPSEAADLLTGTVRGIVAERRGGLLSFGALGTVWAASSGILAVMQQLNITYDVKESRSFVKTRLIAIGLMLAFGLLIIGAFGLVILGGVLQGWIASAIGGNELLLTFFAVLRWVIIVAMIALAFSLVYYYGPDVEQDFRFISPGSVFGTAVLVIASLGFRLYISNFADYNATYGSIGAVIVLMLWLYIAGLVILLGSEVNSLIEHYSPSGKDKGQRREPRRSRARSELGMES